MNKALFIDRDGTILVEPVPSEQVDSFEKTEFVPGAISALKSIAQLDYEMVMASNQDGLGTASFPYEQFIGPHNLMLRTLEGEGVRFADILIDCSFPCEHLPTRKPGVGMFGKYLAGGYDMASSYVIGDRESDVQLAANLGCKAILLDVSGVKSGAGCTLKAASWAEIAEFLRRESRCASMERVTRETAIRVEVDLDGRSESGISTGLHFFDHMLDQIAHHSGISLRIEARGDLQVDEHHTMEDVAILLGEALRKALGDKRGIERYGFFLPMDECEALVLLDLGGRIDFGWDVPFTREYVGDTPTEMFRHFYKSLCESLRCNLHIRARGENNHHLAEAVFKGFARALRQAILRQPFNCEVASSKGVL